jgi:hypothetical protein
MNRFFALVVATPAMILPALAQDSPPPANPPRVIQEPALRTDPPETFGRGARAPATERLQVPPNDPGSTQPPRNVSPPREVTPNAPH